MVFQSATPSILETSSRLSPWLMLMVLAVRDSRRVCAIVFASRKSRIALSSAGANQACQVVALLTRSLGQREADKARYVNRSAKGATSRSYQPNRKLAQRRFGVNHPSSGKPAGATFGWGGGPRRTNIRNIAIETE